MDTASKIGAHTSAYAFFDLTSSNALEILSRMDPICYDLESCPLRSSSASTSNLQIFYDESSFIF